MIIKEEPLRFRHELKHSINLSDYLSIRPRLLAIAWQDSNTGTDGKYKVRSLYFESPNDKALREKLEGAEHREKFRIRYYNDDPSKIKLEKKIKVNGLGNKQSVCITKEECEKLLAGDTGWMRNSREPIVLELYAKMQYQQLKPKTVVDYIREPYLYEPGNVRVTIDSRIETGIHSKDFFNTELPTVRTNAENVIILEVKYDAFLPDIIADAVQIKNRKAAAFSKYAISRMYG